MTTSAFSVPSLLARRVVSTLGAAAALAAATATPARAAIDCWVDEEHAVSADRLPVGDPKLAPLRAAAREVNALLHRMPEMHALPRTRLRSTWQLAGQWGEPARAFHYVVRDHRESMWGPGCSVIKGADRLGPMAAIVAIANAPTAFMPGPPVVKDERLQAWPAPQVIGEVRGRPVHSHGTGENFVVFSRRGAPVWVPVTTAEYLDHVERDLARRLDEAQAADADVARMTSPAEVERLAGVLAGSAGQAAADAYRAQARAEAARIAARPSGAAIVRAEIDKVRAFRASLGPAGLAEQARDGHDGRQDGVPPERRRALVKVNPAFPWDRSQPLRVQMLFVSVGGGDVFAEPMQRVLQALDLAALDALIAP